MLKHAFKRFHCNLEEKKKPPNLCLQRSMSSVVPSCVNLPAFIPPTNVTLLKVLVERQSSNNVFFDVRFDSKMHTKRRLTIPFYIVDMAY